jgi:pre-mRNA-splicing factor SPF27
MKKNGELKNGQSILDMNRYTLPPPPANRRSDISAWKEAVDNAHAQVEHQNLR